MIELDFLSETNNLDLYLSPRARWDTLTESNKEKERYILHYLQLQQQQW